jgi:tetrapyrrole methylase family protein / MazG family protein
MKKGSLTVVGCGIKFMSHLTTEAKTAMQHADKLFYLLNEPAMCAWLQQYYPHCQSLADAYVQYPLRQQAYQAMTGSILEAVNAAQHVCVVLEGHPVVFAKPALDAVRQASTAGYVTRILPGISAEDYLFAELQIDPGAVGCLSYEATDFLIHKRVFDGYSHLILWQVSVIGLLGHCPDYDHKPGTQVLVDYLSDCYDLNHEVILFAGSQYPHIASRQQTLALKDLPDAPISRTTTLYVPPARQAHSDREMLEKLGININDLTLQFKDGHHE